MAPQSGTFWTLAATLENGSKYLGFYREKQFDDSLRNLQYSAESAIHVVSFDMNSALVVQY